MSTCAVFLRIIDLSAPKYTLMNCPFVSTFIYPTFLLYMRRFWLIAIARNVPNMLSKMVIIVRKFKHFMAHMLDAPFEKIKQKLTEFIDKAHFLPMTSYVYIEEIEEWWKWTGKEALQHVGDGELDFIFIDPRHDYCTTWDELNCMRKRVYCQD